MSRVIRSTVARFTADISDWERNTRRLTLQINNVGQQFENLGRRVSISGQLQSVTNMFSDLSKKLTIGAGVALATKGITSAISAVGSALSNVTKTGIDFDSQIEQASISFEVLSGSAAIAKDIISSLYEYAAKTPFEFPDVAEAGRALEVVNLSAKKNIGWIGDLAAANPQATIQEVARAIARLKSGDFGESFERLRDFGISKELLLGQGLKFDKSGSYKGSVAEALTAVENIVKQKYDGMAAAQSKSFKGQLSTLKDNINSTFGEVMKPVFESLTNNILPKVGRALENIRNSRFFQWFVDGVKWVVDAVNTVLTPAIDSIGRTFNNTINYVKKDWGDLQVTLAGIKVVIAPIITIIESMAATFVGAINGMIAGVGSLIVSLGDMANTAMSAGSVVSKALKGDIKGAVADLGTTLDFAGKAAKSPADILKNTTKAYADGVNSVYKGFAGIKNLSFGDPYANYTKPTWVPDIKAANTYKSALSDVGNSYDGLTDKIKSFVDSLKSQTDAFKNFVGIFDKATTDQPISMERWLNRLKGQVRALTQYQASIKTLEARANAGVISQGMFQDLRALGPSAAKQLQVLAASNNAKLTEASRLYGQKGSIAGNMAYDVVKGNMAAQAQIIQIVNNFNGGAKDLETEEVSEKVSGQIIKKLKAVGAY